MKLVILNLFYYLLCFQAAYAQSPSNGLVAHWTFDEGTGTTAQDSTGQNNTGTLINGPSWLTGRSGNALSFDGINDYVEINDNNILDLTGGQFTLSAWIYPESYGEDSNGRIIDHGGGSAGEGGWTFLLNNYHNDQNLRQSIKNGNIGNSYYSDIGSISLNTWQHVAVTLQSGTITFYVNGQIMGQSSGVPAPADRNAPVRIGMRATDFFRTFAGVIDEVRIYDRSLTPQDIMDLYNQTPPLTDMNPPVISDGQPVGVLPLETTTATLSVKTVEAATCKYSTSPNTPYSSMPDTFESTGGTTHTTPLSGLEYVQSRAYYIKCRDQSGNSNPVDYTISFSFNRTVYSISPLGSDVNPGTDVLPMKTIQHALDSYSENNSDETIIKVAQGTYYENIFIVCCATRTNWRILGGWNSDFSERDEDHPSKTVIDGGGKKRVIKINVPALNLTIEGLTIKNGFDSSVGGGIAVFPFYHGTVTLNLFNNIIARNISGSAGGGIYVLSKEYAITTLTLTDNVIVHNSADDICGGVCVISENHADTTVTFTGNTVIDNRAGYEGGGIYLRSYSGAAITSTFTNNAITHNSADYFGAGIYVYSEADATLTTNFIYNRITGNTGTNFGGGVYLHSVSDSMLTAGFSNNTISGNSSAIHGGGIYALSALGAAITSSFSHNIIIGNSTVYDGGGVFSWGSTTSAFTNNIIAGNSASRGAGVFATEGTALSFLNDTITGNSAGFLGGGIYSDSISDANTNVDITNTIIWGNEVTDIDNFGGGIFNVSYSNIGSGPFVNNPTNMNADPIFVGSVNGTYHLSSSSPLIDRGENSDVSWGTDIDGDPRIMYGKVDVGADEHVFNFIKSYILPTIDGDLSEYAEADSITLTPSSGGNTVTARAVRDDEALYIAFAVSDAQLNASVTTRDGSVSNDDSVGWVIDTLNNDGGSVNPNLPYMLSDDFQGIVNILNTQYDQQGTTSGAPTSSWNGSWQSAVRFNGTLNDNSDIDNGYTVEVKIPWTTLGFAAAPTADTAVRIGFLVYDKDVSACDINPDGTYIDAENFTGTVIQGAGTFSVESSQAGHIGSGYLRSNSGASSSCPSVHEGKEYEVNFTHTGTYKVWLKSYSTSGSADSLFIGLDGNCAGYISPNGIYNQWVWTKHVSGGVSEISVTSTGNHKINIWVREPNHLVDGIYLTKGTETPSDSSHGTEINPAMCGASHSTLWPQGGGTEFQNASNWQEIRFTVMTRYYCDYDHDGHMASSPSNVCIGTECQPQYCQSVPGSDCDDNDFYARPGQTWYKDSDNDDYSDGTTELLSCTRPAGYKTDLELAGTSGDCDDRLDGEDGIPGTADDGAHKNPGATEVWYDGVDQDCNGLSDYDQDADGYNSAAFGGTDCDDIDPFLNPDTKWYPDFDGDTYGNPTYAFVQCNKPSGPPGYVLVNSDCDDNDTNIYPGGPEVRIANQPISYYWIYELQTAYNDAINGETIQCQVAMYSGNLTLGQNKSVIMKGGYDCTYSVITGVTTIEGNKEITDGSVTVEDFEVQLPLVD